MLKIELTPTKGYEKFGAPKRAEWVIKNPDEELDQIMHSFASVLRTIGFTDKQIENHLGDY